MTCALFTLSHCTHPQYLLISNKTLTALTPLIGSIIVYILIIAYKIQIKYSAAPHKSILTKTPFLSNTPHQHAKTTNYKNNTKNKKLKESTAENRPDKTAKTSRILR